MTEEQLKNGQNLLERINRLEKKNQALGAGRETGGRQDTHTDRLPM